MRLKKSPVPAHYRGLIVHCVVGTPADIAGGRGDSALTTEQAAVRLGVSTTWFRRYVSEGVIQPCATFGKSLLFLERDVDTLHDALERA